MQPNPIPTPRCLQHILPYVFLSERARQVLLPEQPLRQCFDMLLQEQLHSDALKLFPHLVPKRVAVWWGCLCCWQAHRPRLEGNEAEALQAALTWVHDPSETHRRQAGFAGQVAGMSTSAGALAMAAFWSGGTMSKPEFPTVPPPEPLTAQVVAGAVRLAAVYREPMQYERHEREFLALGMGIADEKLFWTSSKPAVPEVPRANFVKV